MKMYDAGQNYEDSDMAPIEQSSKKDKKYYPHVDVNSNNFPEIEKMKVGKTYVLMIEVKPTRLSINEREGKNKQSSMCFEVKKIGMAKDQAAAMSGDEKTDKMIDKMYKDNK